MNAFNLMDNMDGAAGTTASVSAMGAGALALIIGDGALTALCFAIAGACAGFLPHNLAGPARSFMGDGGSLPVGFVVASAVMAAAAENSPGLSGLVVAALLVALVILDSTLVTVSRSRGRRQVLVGGRDHLTHRLVRRLGSPRRVALGLAVAQLSLSAVTVTVASVSVLWILTVGSVVATLGVLTIWTLESAPWSASDGESAGGSARLPAPKPAIQPPAAAVSIVAASAVGSRADVGSL
jgi:UDP-GlcNAc:undecaprenyl-phosphate GlcNAc-1-phosphate transferase